MKTLALNILDIVQNSIRAKATEISIEIVESVRKDSYRITITDDGSGIPEDILEKVTDPFVTTRTRRRMGLGLPLLKYHAELTGGKLGISSENKKGTTITASFSNLHLDRQPLGDIAGVLMILIASNQGIEFLYKHSTDKGEYIFSSFETKQYLGVESLYERDLLKDLENIVFENLKEIEVSGLEFK
jgi:hypothetical protein